jgi:NapC/NirT cytochrome c family protein
MCPAAASDSHSRHLIRNPISLLGGVLVATGVGTLAFLLASQVFDVETSPYIGMLVFTALPAVLTLGLVLVPAGMLWEARRQAAAARRGLGAPPALQLDFSNPQHLRAILLFATFTAVIVGVMGATGYRTVEFMDSPAFCGRLCHTVMKPEYESFKRSAHAEVRCTACHIGPGASWYVKSKLGGMGQLAAVLLNSYPRPVPAPVKNLRPARATCEGCHWREQAHGLFLRVYRSYLPDETNTLHARALAFRVGTGGSLLEEAGGVHWHTSAKLYYRSADEQRQVIARVVVEKPGGNDEWVNPDVSATQELQQERLMDCIDCHNRAAHKIPAPDTLIDDALTAGRMDTSLPYLKREALRLMGIQESTVTDPAQQALKWEQPGWFDQLFDFYRANYPQVASTKEPAIQAAIDELKRITTLVFYPDMNTSWLTYAENRGHSTTGFDVNTGCFRCHAKLVDVTTGQQLPGGVGGGGCLTCHGLGDQGQVRAGENPLNETACSYCHVPIPIEELVRPTP